MSGAQGFGMKGVCRVFRRFGFSVIGLRVFWNFRAYGLGCKGLMVKGLAVLGFRV